MLPMVLRRTRRTPVESDKWAQRSVYGMSKYAAKNGKAFGPQVTEVDWSWLVAKIAEAPTPRELRSMSGVVKNTNLRVEQHGLGAGGRVPRDDWGKQLPLARDHTKSSAKGQGEWQ